MALTINNFWGAETGGQEELTVVSGSAGVGASSPAPKSGGYRYYSGGGTSSYFEVSPFNTVADAGNDYVVGFAVQISDVTTGNPVWAGREGSNGFISLSRDTNSYVIADAIGGTIRTITDASSGVTANTWHNIEIYFQHSASGTVEVFINGVSQGSDSSQDLTDGGTFDTFRFFGDTVLDIWIDDIYLMSGATSSADRLGGAEVFAYRSSLASATGDWGTSPVLQTGQWADAQEVPFGEFNVAAFTDATARRGGVDTDDAYQTSAYTENVFLNSVSDPDANWTGDANAIDGSTATEATNDTGGGSSTSEYLLVSGIGDGQPDNSLYGIDSVDITVAFNDPGSSSMYIEVRLAGAGELLLSDNTTTAAAGDRTWSFTLSMPTGGWTATKLAGLEVKFWVVQAGKTFGVQLVGAEVLYGGGPNEDTHITGDIKAMKGIWRMKRTGGSGAVHYGILGNTGTAIADSDRTADFNPTTAYANYFDVREDNLPLSTEYGRIGFEKDNKGQDFNCAEMLFQILHVPPPPSAYPYHLRRIKRDNMRTLINL